MHDLLQEMGREIVRRESRKNPGKCSRLWKPDDVIRTLKNNTGAEEVEGISLNTDNLKDVHLNLSCQVFDKMSNLKLLLFTYNIVRDKLVYLSNGLNSLLDELIILKWIPNLSDFLSLEEVDLSGCVSLVEFSSSVQQLNRLWNVSLSGCKNVIKFPLTSASIEMLDLNRTAIGEVPLSIQSLTNLTELYIYGCRRIKHILANIFKLKSLLTLYLDGCFKLETFPEILEKMEILNSPESITESHSSIEHLNEPSLLKLSYCENLEMLPSSIRELTSLEHLDLSNCSKLHNLPNNLGNLKSLKELIVRGTAVGQLPSSIRYLENLESLDCSKCRGLTILPPLSGLRSLRTLLLKKCNLMEIPEDIGCLSSLKWLDLCGNMFESLPKSIKHLSKLETLLLRDCSRLQSSTELPVALKMLAAINWKQLCQALPDASEFKRCITSKYHENVGFLFTNSFNLDQKAVSNVFEESLKVISLLNLNTLFPLISLTLQITIIFLLQRSEELPTRFQICLPGNEIPELFTYQSSGSSVNIQVLRQDLVNRKFMRFAICAVLGIEEYHHYHDYLVVDVYCHFETPDDNIHFPPFFSHPTNDPVFINSDHILLGYSSFSKLLPSFQNLEMLHAGDSDYVDIPFEFKNSADLEVKYCAVHPIYAKPMKITGATIEDIGETSERRSGRFDDNEEAGSSILRDFAPNQI
ncbi:hypothetical protein Ddye_027576 [Dipteronia dyeriana]|uniref:C-JID domain-containing protein n=1 Tax=Dipteronia dyeriana TaxID=168575 RepID=A0AAD9WQM3_9ROSI|nr:hypothetical protein Ddye_027576 [Dipteronia dyeriana]